MRVDLESVDLRYPGATRNVLDGIRLHLSGDRSVAIVGPSGSGKSTLLSLIGGLLRPTGGTISVDGRPVNDRQAQRELSQRTAWILQSANLFPRRTALENAIAAAVAGGDSAERSAGRCIPILCDLGLEDRVHAEARTLSGGEAQRVCVARAIVAGRELILADEPTGQLDSRSSTTVFASLIRHRPPGAGLIVVTHDLQIAALCDEMWTLQDGRLSTSGAR